MKGLLSTRELYEGPAWMPNSSTGVTPSLEEKLRLEASGVTIIGALQTLFLKLFHCYDAGCILKAIKSNASACEWACIQRRKYNKLLDTSCRGKKCLEDSTYVYFCCPQIIPSYLHYPKGLPGQNNWEDCLPEHKQVPETAQEHKRPSFPLGGAICVVYRGVVSCSWGCIPFFSSEGTENITSIMVITTIIGLLVFNWLAFYTWHFPYF